MRVSKNSLLIRMVFYNDIAIILASFTIALFLTFIAFQSMESKVIDSTRDKITLVNRAYNGEILRAKDELNQIIRNISNLGNRSFQKNFTYAERAVLIKNQLTRRNIDYYSDAIIAIVDENGFVYGDTGEELNDFQIDKKGFQRNLASADADVKTSYCFKYDGELYSRIIVRYNEDSNRRLYIVLTLPITNKTMKNLSNQAGLREEDKIFLTTDDKYKIGTFNLKDGTNFFTKKDSGKLVVRNYNYIFRKKKIDGQSYYTAIMDIVDYKNETIGNLGVAIYYQNIEILKIIVSLSIILIVLIFIAISTTISARMFSKLLEPLGRIVDAAEEVSKGNYRIFVKPEGADEMRTLSKTFNKMAADILSNEQKNKSKNRKLIGTLKRIDAIEKILMNIQIEDDMNVTVKDILSALTSEMGLGYSRAMYFRYSREIDTMVGEFSVVNNRVKREILNGIESTGGFKFQIEELDKLVKLIRIPFKNNNLVSKALLEKRIVYYNEKGYKHNLGNELFKSLGINNFLIMPIYSETRNYGCIVIDYFGKENQITQEEVELLTLLFLNISIRIKNKTLEEEKIDSERTATIAKLVDRFFNSRELSFEKMLKFMEQINEYENNSLFSVQIQEIKNEISKLRREREILNEYVNVKENNNFEIIEVEKIITEIVAYAEPKLEKLGINISYFINCNAKILGDKERLSRAIYEIIKNAKESFDRKPNATNKKINIIVTKEKNVDKIRINIIDNGIGMTKEQIRNIFEPFVGYNENAPGLGLAIVSRIIKDHHGVIKYSSREDEGTDVKITLNIYKEEIL